MTLRRALLHGFWMTAVVSAVIALWSLSRTSRNGGPLGYYERLVMKLRSSGPTGVPVAGTVESRLADFLKRHPELTPEIRTVEESRNGFLQLGKLDETIAPSSASGLDPEEILGNAASWDDADAQTILTENAELLVELHRIGAMTERSSAMIPVNELWGGRSKRIDQFCHFLQVEMGAHFRSGNFAAALESLRAIYGLAAHTDELESMSLMMRIVGLGTRTAALNDLIENLPSLVASRQDLEPWLEVLRSETSAETHLIHTMRCQAVFQLRAMDLPIAVSGNGQIRNFTAYEDAIAARVADITDFLKSGSGKTISMLDAHAIDSQRRLRESRLEKPARDLFVFTDFSEKGIVERIALTAVATDLRIAVLEFLEKERRGENATFEQCRRNPRDGQPYAFDPVTRRAAFDAEDLKAGGGVDLPKY